MTSLFDTALAAPVANLLIVVGIVFLGLAVVGRAGIGAGAELGRNARVGSGGIGAALMVLGIALYIGIFSPRETGTPNLTVFEFAVSPSTPVAGKAVTVRVVVRNAGTGTARASAFAIKWWANESNATPDCTWQASSLLAGTDTTFSCTYAGYPTRPEAVTTRVVVDEEGQVAETSESDNSRTIALTVARR